MAFQRMNVMTNYDWDKPKTVKNHDSSEGADIYEPLVLNSAKMANNRYYTNS